MIAYFVISKSIPFHSQYLSSLFNWDCSDVSLFAIIARSSAYAAVFIVILDVPSMYPFFLLCNQHRSGSRNIMNKYGLRVSPWIVPLCMDIFCISLWQVAKHNQSIQKHFLNLCIVGICLD